MKNLQIRDILISEDELGSEINHTGDAVLSGGI